MDVEKICFEIDKETADRFNVAVMLNKENINDAIEKCIKSYIKETFLNAADIDCKQTGKAETATDIAEGNFAKARQRIPKWAQMPTQNYYKIIQAYFVILDDRGIVTFKELLKLCSDKYNYPRTYVADFRGNFEKLKTDAGNSYGKVFTVIYDVVEIWDEVADVLLKYRDAFL